MSADQPTETDPPVVSVFDPNAITEQIDDIERMMSELLAPTSNEPNSAANPTSAEPVSSLEPEPSQPNAASTLDLAMAEVDAATPGNDSGGASDLLVASHAETPVDVRAQTFADAVESDGFALEAAPAFESVPQAEPTFPRPRRTVGQVLSAIILPPLQSFSAPMAKVPVGLRPVVSALALTLPLWIPGVWWLSKTVAAAQRVRALQSIELEALSESLHPATPAEKSGGNEPSKVSGGSSGKPAEHEKPASKKSGGGEHSSGH